MDFAPPILSVNKDGWGPVAGSDFEGAGVSLDFNIESLEKYPIKKIAHICDFSLSAVRFQEQRLAKGKGKGKSKGPVVLPPGKDEDGFALVAEKEKTSKGGGRGGKAGFGRGKGRGKGVAANYQEGILGQKQKPFFNNNNQNQAKGKGGKGGKGKGKFAYRQGRGAGAFKEWSVATKTEWTVMRELNLSLLAKLQLDAKDVKYSDAVWCGELRAYNKEYDRVGVQTCKNLKKFENLDFYNVTAQDDPHLQEALQTDESVSVIATDQVLAVLIAAARSSYSWDLVVTKINNKILIDKRYGSQVDFLTVNETASEPPSSEDPTNINGPIKLGQEASCINQNFSQMVIDSREATAKTFEPHPFVDEEDQAASGAYRYRKIVLPGNNKDENKFNQGPVTILARTEINASLPEDPNKYVSVKALNEFESSTTPWKKHLETQRGAVLATELKNNSFKIGRWVAEALLSGCETMKIGYVTRSRPKDTTGHSVLGVQTYITDSFADQIGLTRNNAFGILRSIIDLIMGFEDGKYLIVKDPNKPTIRFHEVPWETFNDDDEDDEDGEDEDDNLELDEDGNIAPERASVPVPMPNNMRSS